MNEPLAYNYADAARVTGYSIDVIKKAVHTGDLVPVRPSVGGRELSKPVILAEELKRWLTASR